jgi:ABC-2 type transport system ATP-binding protein
MGTAPAISVRDLRKTFTLRERRPGVLGAIRGLVSAPAREHVALDGVTFTLEPGERVAFLGPNGAGKSTTLKLLTGILHPTSGEARVLGLVPHRERRRLGARIGSVFGQRSTLWYHLPPRDTFALLRHVYGVEPATFRRRHDALVDSFGLAPLLDRPVRRLSLGERMRCELVAALLHAPEVLFLDEPTIGLDVTAKAGLRDLVRELSVKDGCTLLLTSHDPGDMEHVCERAIVIHEGRLLLDKPVAQLRGALLRRKVVTLATEEREPALRLDGVTRRSSEPHRLVLEVDLARTPVDRVVAEALKSLHLTDLTVEDPPMEEVIKAIYRSGSP